MLSKLEKELSPPLKHWQIAFNGVWEKAIEISPTPSQNEIDQTTQAILNGAQDVAIEAFFGDRNSNDFFFTGIRIAAIEKSEQATFVKKLFNTVSDTNFENIKQAIEKSLGKAKIMQTQPDFLELGAEGFWKSYGSYQIWRQEKAASPANIDDIQNNASQLLKPFRRAIMMELAWNAPHPMWLGIPVSEKINDAEFRFSKKRYEHLLKAALD